MLALPRGLRLTSFKFMFLQNTANSIKVDIHNSQMSDLGDKNDRNNQSFMYEYATNIMLTTIFVIPPGH